MPKKTKNMRKRMPDTSLGSLEEHTQLVGLTRSLAIKKQQALQFLNASQAPSKIKFREKQLQRIQQFFVSCVKGQKRGHKWMMLLGQPGIGKTLCSHTVLTSLGIDVIKINSNTVRSFVQVQKIIQQKLLKQAKGHTSVQIARQLQQMQQPIKPCVVYIQEIQLLFKSANNIVSQDFFYLFGRKKLPLFLLGVSNSLKALQKACPKFSVKIEDVQTIVFAAYTVDNIQQLMRDRLAQAQKRSELKINFPAKLLKFAAQKLQNLGRGDFRLCIQFLKETVGQVLRGSQEENQIGIAQVHKVFRKMHIAKDDVMLTLPFQQQLVLISLYNYLKREQALAINLKAVQGELTRTYQALHLTNNKTDIKESINELQQYCLIELKTPKNSNNEVRVELKVGLGEIETAFQQHAVLKKFVQ